jgi:signaling intermediate in Toll pathway protein
MFEAESSIVVKPSVHEQEDGTILGMCITGTSSKDSLATWTKALQQTNPSLQYIPIVFMLRSPAVGLQVYNEMDDIAIKGDKTKT